MCVTVPVLHGMVCNLRCVGVLEGHEIEILQFFTQKTQCGHRSLPFMAAARAARSAWLRAVAKKAGPAQRKKKAPRSGEGPPQERGGAGGAAPPLLSRLPSLSAFWRRCGRFTATKPTLF